MKTLCPFCTDGNAAPIDSEGQWIRCGSCGGTGELKDNPLQAVADLHNFRVRSQAWFRKERPMLFSVNFCGIVVRERECCFCGLTFTGARAFCYAASCEQAWLFRMEERRYRNPYGPVGSSPRKTFLIGFDPKLDPDEKAQKK